MCVCPLTLCVLPSPSLLCRSVVNKRLVSSGSCDWATRVVAVEYDCVVGLSHVGHSSHLAMQWPLTAPVRRACGRVLFVHAVVMVAGKSTLITECVRRYDTIIEGVGLDRLTANFSAAVIDDAFRCTDQEAVHMSRWLLRHEGIFVGSSSAMHCVGAVKAAMLLGPGHTIVTLLCDSGQRHVSRLWNPEFLASRGLHSDRCDDAITAMCKQ